MGKAPYKKYMKPTKTKNPKTRGNYSTGLKKCFDTCTCIQCRKKLKEGLKHPYSPK